MIDQLSILKESIRRSLENGYLSAGRPLNIPQREALTHYHSFVDLPPAHDRIDRRLAYFDMATGTGKTGFFSVIARHARFTAQDWGVGEQFKIVIVEPTTLLLKQTYDELVAAAPELRPAIGFYGGGSKDLSCPVTIMTYDAWVELTMLGHLQDVSLEVMDESHHGLSDLRQKVSRSVLNGAIRLGVTASSQYDLEKTMEITHHNLVYKLGLRDAIQQGFLTDYAHIQFGMMRILPSLTDRERQGMARGELPALKQREWSHLAVRNYATMRDEVSGQPLSDKRAAFFAANTYHADDLAGMLNTNPILRRKAQEKGFKNVAISVHSVGFNDEEQQGRLEAFKAGEYMAITGDRKIQAGFDHPPVKFTACYPGNSLVSLVQEIGRSTRKYFDPRTGEAQGTVILETIPYIGHPDPKEDEESQTRALAETITAYEILKTGTVYSRTRAIAKKKEKIRPKKSIVLSPTCTAEIYTSEHDALLVSRLIEDARQQLRIQITPIMLDELKDKIASRGGYGGHRLAREIEKYETERNLPSTGLLYYEITTVLTGQVKSMKVAEWLRLNETLDAMPLVNAQERIEITPTMLAELKDKIAERGGYSYVRLMQEVGKYDAENNLPSSGLTQPTIARIIIGNIRSMEALQWQRFNDVVLALPVREVGWRIEITPDMIRNFKDKVKSRGRLGAVRIMREVEKYETARQLAPVDITHAIINGLLSGHTKSLPTQQWQRLNDVISAIPSLQLDTYTLITPEMIVDVKAKVAARGGHGARALTLEVRKYEAEKKLYSVRLNMSDIAAVLAGTAKSMHTVKWQRLMEVIDAMPEVGGRIEITDEVFVALNKKIAERGGFGSKRLFSSIEEHERSNQLASIGLTSPMIQTILQRQVKTALITQWARLNEVIDALPLLKAQERVEFTPDMATAFKDKFKAKVRFGRDNGIPLLLRLIGEYEQENNLPSTGIDEQIITGLLGNKFRSVGVLQWRRLNDVLDSLPDIVPQGRIRLTAEMRATVREKIKRKGDLGALRLAREVEKYETSQGLPSSGLTSGILGAAVFVEAPKVRRIDARQWSSLSETLDALPDVEPEARVAITPEALAQLKEKIAARGGYGQHRLLQEVKKYEARKGVASVGLTEQLLHHTLGGRARSLKATHWQLLNDVVDDLPLQERRERIEITPEMLSTLLEEIAARGDLKYRLLFREVEKFEERKELEGVGLNESIISKITNGDAKTVDSAQWRRLKETVAELPLQAGVQRVTITDAMLERLQADIVARGNFGGVRIAGIVRKYEDEKGLADIGLDKNIVVRILSGRTKTAEERHLKRLDEVIQSLPLAEAKQRIEITPEMVEELNRKIRERGNLRAQRLFNLSEQEDHPAKLSFNYISQFLLDNCKVRTTEADRWARLNEVIDRLPIQAAGSSPSGRKADPRVDLKVGLPASLNDILAGAEPPLSDRKQRLGQRNPRNLEIFEAFEEVLNETLGKRKKRASGLSQEEVMGLFPVAAARALTGLQVVQTVVKDVAPELFRDNSQRPAPSI